MNIANVANYDTIHCIIVYIWTLCAMFSLKPWLSQQLQAACHIQYLLLTADSDVSPCCFWLNLDSSDIGSCRPMRAWDEELFAKLVFEFNVVTA